MAVKVTIPQIAATGPGGALYDLVDNLSNINSEAVKYPEGDNLIIEFPDNIKDENKFRGDQDIILSILDNSGEIEGYLFGIKQPSASVGIDVPIGVPLRLFKGDGVRNFLQWFANNAQTWINNVTDEIMYYTDPNPSGVSILKASEAEIIRQLDPNADDPDQETHTFSFLTVAEVQEIVKPGGIPDPNWEEI